MASFDLAIPTVLEHEGGFVDDKVDPGGATNWGISIRFLRSAGIIIDKDGDGDMDAHDMRLLTRSEAIEIYRRHFWRPIYAKCLSQAVATKVFDTAVNMGHKQAHLILQRAVAECGVPITIDGAFGPSTLRAVNSIGYDRLLEAFRREQSRYYESLVLRKPAMRKYLRGWLRRANS